MYVLILKKVKEINLYEKFQRMVSHLEVQDSI